MKKISDKRKKVMEERKRTTLLLHLLYQEIWKERGPYSEISGKYLGQQPLSTYFHHILSKNKYPEFMFNKENIILITSEEHEKVEKNPNFFEEINKRRDGII